MIVCTLCSCYPFSLLGMSPAWFKSNEYRARAVRDPRGVLKEFGVELDDGVEVRVWDSTSEQRFMVVPQRPEGTEGWAEDALAALVTRNSMIGTDRNLKTTAETT
jgi:nitrile hydratase